MSHTRLFHFSLILLVIGLIMAPWQPVVALTSGRSGTALLQSANPIYVDADAPGPLHDGLSWATAYTDLQTALATATSGGEIWVAEGIYTPGAVGDRAATFQPQGDVILYGGFVGTETALGERDWVAHPTVLSGDLDHNDLADPNGVVTDTANITGDNAYHVMTLDYNTTVDGFIITAGQAIGVYPENGGGVLNNGSSTLRNMILSGNQATFGAGMFNANGSPTLTDVTFSDNVAESSGGGLYNIGYYPNATLTHVTFTHNQAGDGGGMYNIYSSTPALTDVTFTGNQASNYGGGMYNGSSSAPTLTEVTFTGNQASDGGGMYNTDQASPNLTNVTFANNLSSSGNGGGGMFNYSSTPTLFNVTFTGNSVTGNNFGGGGAMYNMSSDPHLTNVTFSNNQTEASGGGIYNSSSDPTLINVAFSNNQANYGGGMYNRDTSAPALITVTFTSNLAFIGGGMLNDVSSSPTLINVIFSDNRAYTSGGGMENDWDSNPTLTNVTFSGNAAYDGGGMRNFQSNPALINVIFSGNQALVRGGGMINEEGSHPALINTTFSGNLAGSYGGGGGLYNVDSSPTLANCILWGNDAATDPEISNVGTSAPDITYSDVAWNGDVYPGTGNLNLDPQFVSPSAAAVAPTTTGDYHLLSTSPVIDAGNNFSITVSTDRDGHSRLMNVLTISDTGLGTPPIVDMGAYEVEDTSVTLILNASGNGTITSVPSGPAFTPGTVVTLTATPGAGSSFTGWSGALSGKVNPVTLTLDADKVVTGTFTLNTYRLNLYAIGSGSVTSNPPGPLFAYGTVVTLTAVPNSHSIFTGWYGALSGLTNPITITMNANKTVLATFQRRH